MDDLDRSKRDKKYTWDLEKIYPNTEAVENNIKKLDGYVEKIVGLKGHIMDSADTLLDYLRTNDQMSRMLEKLYVYAYLKYDEDTNINEHRVLRGRMTKIYTDIVEKLFFITPEILKSDFKCVEEFIKENKDLETYRFHLSAIFRDKKHTLKASEEALMARATEILDGYDDTYSTFVNTDLQHETINVEGRELVINEANFVELLREDSQTVREAVFKSYYKTYGTFINTFANTLKFSIKTNFFVSKSRKYKNPLIMKLAHYDINPKIYDNLIKTVNKNLKTLHRYIKLKKDNLKLKEMHMYDIYTDMTLEKSNKYTYEEAMERVLKALEPLGKEYIDQVKKAFTDRWIDVYYNKGKKTGAYSSGTFDTAPYILLNFQGSHNDIATLAHEMGHSMHSFYTNKTQEYVNSGYSIFLAEIASTVNEILLTKYLLNVTKDKEEKKYILSEVLDKFKGTLYRQTQFAEFEKTIYEREEKGEILTSELLSKIYYDLNKKYYGKDIISDDEIKYEWARIPHFYRPFYVYQYATGISVACQLASDILNEKDGALDRYMTFLKSGSSDYPVNILKSIGIDVTNDRFILKAVDMFNEFMDEFEKIEK